MKSAIAALIIAASANACDNEWIWEECSQMYYRDCCDNECYEEGWVYWDDWNLEEFEVTVDEFAGWSWCQDD